MHSAPVTAAVSPSIVTPASTGLADNGYGGSWYTVDFAVPVSNLNDDPNVVKAINWYMTDQFVQSTANAGSIYGISFGICLILFVYVLLLTPWSKMRRQFFVLYILALVSEMVRSLVDTIRVGKIGMSPYSAYLSLTGDVGSTKWSTGYINLSITKQAAAILSYIFTIACLWTQAYSLLRHIRHNHSRLYWAIMGVLTGGSLATLAFDFMYAYSQIRRLQGYPTRLNFNTITSGTWMGLALSFALWSLVSLGSVIHLIYTRIRFGVRANRASQFSLALLVLVLLDSFLVPITLCLLGLIPNRFDITKATSLVTPAVLALLPITFLFTTAHRTEMSRGREADDGDGHGADADNVNNEANSDNGSTICERCINCTCRSTETNSDSTVLQELNPLPRARELRHRENPFRDQVRDPVDQELADIDAMPSQRTSQASEDLLMGHVPDEQVLQQRARRVMRSLVSSNITPRSSQTNLA
ncbi:hypothetical protein DV738_g426, partial [Chaetothyriales sp. CBS 135597]